MLTGQELVYALGVPVLLAGLIGAVGRWRGWAWAMPVGVGVAFLAGYALLGMPALPPRDGVDWLFWLTVPLMALGGAASTLDSSRRRGAPWVSALGMAAGIVALVIVLPLTRVGTVSVTATVWTSIVLAVVGVGLVLALQWAVGRVGPVAVVAGLCIILGGAGVMVMSSNLRIVGIYGLAAAAAVGAVAASCWHGQEAIGVAVVVVPLIAGLLTAGRYYPEPGVTWIHFGLVLAAPLLVAGAGLVPAKRRWIRGVLAVLAVAVFIAAATMPKAIAAKKAAEEDPYGGVYY